ncbi:pyridoxamine 5'-phosphate oxidase family protein [Sulfitobacter sp. S190]|uniref:pyridoxamine 5'-phosphate oxidase family protein n=1 Tax=Sulfitobacter sp. S190 TaxID=2867022 RepID=UPI0021A7985F|nr:pyridoxamine 5'-phosphate oxidase family protein [Sulfitobacter sp. S190]
MTDTLKQKFWDRMDDTRTGMLAATDAPAVPMTHYVDEEAGVLWFITAKGTDLGSGATGGAAAQYLVSSKDEHLYARIDGRLEAISDPRKLDELWNVFAAAWFEDGKRDEDVQLLRFAPAEAEPTAACLFSSSWRRQT